MPQKQSVTIRKARGRLNEAIALLREHNVPDAEIAQRIAKAAEAEYGNDATRYLQSLYEDEVRVNGDPFQKAAQSDGSWGSAVVTTKGLNDGAHHLTAGRGTWQTVPDPGVKKSLTTRSRAEAERATEVAKNRRKIRSDINKRGLSS